MEGTYDDQVHYLVFTFKLLLALLNSEKNN